MSVLIYNEEANKAAAEGRAYRLYKFQWKDEKPTKPGWYWVFWKNGKWEVDSPTLEKIEIYKNELGVWRYGIEDWFESLERHSPCYWLGPIPAPAPPENT